jgi:hypothetical protein
MPSHNRALAYVIFLKTLTFVWMSGNAEGLKLIKKDEKAGNQVAWLN